MLSNSVTTKTALVYGCVLLATLLLEACATQGTSAPTTRPATRHAPEVLPPGYVRSYEVFGKTYYVMADAGDFRESGTASWYGPKFDGRPTANGETFDMHKMTAAHKSLPLPTYVQVTNLANQRTIVVRVNDRGPFIGDRVIDLSYAAAVALDMIGPGTGQVDIVAIDTPVISGVATLQSNAQPALPASLDHYIQVGAFADTGNAMNMAQQLEQSGIRDVIIEQITLDDRVLQRVKIGPLPASADQAGLLKQLHAMGLSNARLVSQ